MGLLVTAVLTATGSIGLLVGTFGSREALSILDLSVLVRPCPKRGPRFREELKRRRGVWGAGMYVMTTVTERLVCGLVGREVDGLVGQLID